VPRKRDIESALDKCLSYLEQGDSIEDCLARYPGLAQELRPLLRVALRTQQLRGGVTPSSETLAAGRAEFLRRAAALREQPESGRAGVLSRLFDAVRSAWTGLARRRGLTTIAASVLILFGLLGGGTIASANSLPGDPLYPLKRASEQVQLALTFVAETKAELRTSFEQRRLEEVQSVVEVRRVARVRFKGTITSLTEDQWTVSGVDLVVQADTTVEGVPFVGKDVHVEAITQPDGRVVARYLRTIEPLEVPPTATPAPPPATSTATPKATQTGPITPSPTAVIPTKEPTSTQAPSKDKPNRTATLKPTATPEQTATEEPTPTVEPTEAVTATPTPTVVEPPPRDVKVKFEGLISEITSAIWVIGEHSVHTDSNTQVLEEKGRAEVGAWAMVKAIRRQDGSLLALEIVIERPSEIHGEPVEFRGIIDHIGDTEWIVDGRHVEIVESTAINGTPKVGHIAEVKALQLSDGSLIAQHITVKPPELQEVEFEGTIESLGASAWVVDGHTILIDGETVIEGTPTVGLVVEIRAVVLPDSSVVARHIRVKSPPPEPSPTTTPTVNSTATPTLEPSTATPTQEPPTATATLEPPTATPTDAVSVDPPSETTATPSVGEDKESSSRTDEASKDKGMMPLITVS
jgi:hypothetical protein